MSIKRVARMLAFSGLIGSSLIAGSAQAVMMSGAFTLVQDTDHRVLNINEGDTVASVDFDSNDSGVVEAGGVQVFNVTSLILTDLTDLLDHNDNGIFGDDGYLIGDFNLPVNSSAMGPLVALFSSSGAFVGLRGSFMADAMPIRGFIFSATGVSLSASGAGILNFGTGYSDSFDLIPEPGALALIGAGLMGLGFARHRTVRHVVAKKSIG